MKIPSAVDLLKNFRPPVSICMATCNGARFVSDQIRSILDQLQDGDELIVSDDGSTDETVAIIRSFADPRVRIIERRDARRGVSSNFAYALGQARHDFLFLADQDDLWFADKVEKVTRLLQDYDLVVTDCTLIDAEAAQLAPSFFKQHGSGKGFFANLLKNSYLGCCMAFRRSLLEKATPIPVSVPMHDIWFGMMAECVGRPCFYPEPLVAYRRHGSNLSTTSSPSNRPLYKKIRDRCRLLFSLSQRMLELRRLGR